MIHNQFCFVFRNEIFHLFHFVLQPSISDMTVGSKNLLQKKILKDLEMRLVIERANDHERELEN